MVFFNLYHKILIMKCTVWIVIGKDGFHRARKRKPPVSSNEYVFKLDLTAADKLFTKPSFESSIEIGSNPNISLDIKELEEKIQTLKSDHKD